MSVVQRIAILLPLLAVVLTACQADRQPQQAGGRGTGTPVAVTEVGPYELARTQLCTGRPPVGSPGFVLGFCEGAGAAQGVPLDASALKEVARGDEARRALRKRPPDCRAVIGTPVARFCPA